MNRLPTCILCHQKFDPAVETGRLSCKMHTKHINGGQYGHYPRSHYECCGASASKTDTLHFEIFVDIKGCHATDHFSSFGEMKNALKWPFAVMDTHIHNDLCEKQQDRPSPILVVEEFMQMVQSHCIGIHGGKTVSLRMSDVCKREERNELDDEMRQHEEEEQLRYGKSSAAYYLEDIPHGLFGADDSCDPEPFFTSLCLVRTISQYKVGDYWREPQGWEGKLYCPFS